MKSSRNRLRAAAIVLTALTGVGVTAPCAKAQGGRCGAGVDLVVQALEKMSASASNDQLGDANQLLKRAAELCGELGDAWYYRSLVERKLGTRNWPTSRCGRRRSFLRTQAQSSRIRLCWRVRWGRVR